MWLLRASASNECCKSSIQYTNKKLPNHNRIPKSGVAKAEATEEVSSCVARLASAQQSNRRSHLHASFHTPVDGQHQSDAQAPAGAGAPLQSVVKYGESSTAKPAATPPSSEVAALVRSRCPACGQAPNVQSAQGTGVQRLGSWLATSSNNACDSLPPVVCPCI